MENVSPSFPHMAVALAGWYVKIREVTYADILAVVQFRWSQGQEALKGFGVASESFLR